VGIKSHEQWFHLLPLRRIKHKIYLPPDSYLRGWGANELNMAYLGKSVDTAFFSGQAPKL